MANMDIRQEIAKRFLKHWQIAKELGVHESVFCRVLRTELAPERKRQIMDAIKKLSKGGAKQHA